MDDAPSHHLPPDSEPEIGDEPPAPPAPAGAPDLPALLASRLCHDLISPVGAIGNGLDLVAEIGISPAVSEEIAMVADSAARASALLQFYRLAFGRADPDAGAVAREVIAGHAATQIASARIEVEIAPLSGPALPRPVARLVCLMLMAARHVAGGAGALSVRLAADDTLPVLVEVAAARNIDMATGPAALLAGPLPADLSPRVVEFALLRDGAGRLGLDLQARPRGERLVIELRGRR